MATPKNLRTMGNQLTMTMSDNSKITFYPTVNGLYIPKNVSPVPPPPPGGGNGGSGGGYGKYALVNPLPSSIPGVKTYRETFTMNSDQIRNAADIIASAAQHPDITDDMMKAVIVCALVESIMYIWCNVNVPESYNYPYQMEGSDHLSVGLFQQQVPNFGWGSVRECMQTEYSVKSYIGGPNGPRGGAAPAGLVDNGRENYDTIGEWVQDTQESAHPSRYDDSMEGVATIMDALIVKGGTGGSGSMVQPFEPDAYDASDPFGATAGRSRPHTGSDYNRGIGEGTDARMISDGVVDDVRFTDWNGWCLTCKMDGEDFWWAYLHGMNRPSITEGTRVSKGQTGIFRVGNSGTNSLGAHLHITISNTVTAYDGMGSLQNPWEFIEARR